MVANEPAIRRGRLPRGYSLVFKGNVYITGNCRKQTQAVNQTVYLVVNAKEKQIGIAVPTDIYEEVKRKEAETRAARATNVDRRDNSIKNEFEHVILREFPFLPREDLVKILEKALQKRAGKVGRTGQLSDRQKAQLAVRAHIRHCHTQYDDILRGADDKGTRAKDVARKTVQNLVDELAASWAQGRRSAHHQSQKPARATMTASSAACALPSRSIGVEESNKAPRSVRAKPAKVAKVDKKTRRSLTMAPVTEPPNLPGDALQRPFAICKQTPQHQVIDLTMDDDDDVDVGDESIDHMVPATIRNLRSR